MIFFKQAIKIKRDFSFLFFILISSAYLVTNTFNGVFRYICSILFDGIPSWDVGLYLLSQFLEEGKGNLLLQLIMRG